MRKSKNKSSFNSIIKVKYYRYFAIPLLLFFLLVFISIVHAGDNKHENWRHAVSISGLIIFGGVFEDVETWDGANSDRSDLALTAVELAIATEINEWFNARVALLYEDPTFDDETSIDLDAGYITMGNTKKYPLYLTLGKIYVPFGALLTHFPSDPLVALPLTLLFGEISEKALLVGFEYSGFLFSGYVFNGDVNDAGDSDHIKSFGFNANYTLPESIPFGLLVGASYITNVADTDGIADGLGIKEIADSIDGFASYLQLSYKGLFLDAEYMRALEKFQPAELATSSGAGAEPSVWNVEVGINWNRGKNLELALKYAGSHEAGGLGLPENRYGVAINQEIFEGVTGSFAYYMDEFNRRDSKGRNSANTLAVQIAVEF